MAEHGSNSFSMSCFLHKTNPFHGLIMYMYNKLILCVICTHTEATVFRWKLAVVLDNVF